MDNWNLTSVGLVLIGSSIAVACTIIAALLFGISIRIAPYLLITTTLLNERDFDHILGTEDQ